jgi:hypothetical protein
MAAGMACLRFALGILALLCVLANAQCVARCTVMPCDLSSASLPPCHQHKSPAAKPCSSAVFVADLRVPVDALVLTAIQLAPLPAPELRQWLAVVMPVPAALDTGGPAFTVLRV